MVEGRRPIHTNLAFSPLTAGPLVQEGTLTEAMQFLDGIRSSSPKTPVSLPGLQRQFRPAIFAQHQRPRISRRHVARSLDLSSAGMALRGFGSSHGGIDGHCDAPISGGGLPPMDGVGFTGPSVVEGEFPPCLHLAGRGQGCGLQVTGGLLSSAANVRSVGPARGPELRMNVARIQQALAEQRPGSRCSSLEGPSTSARAGHSGAGLSDGPVWSPGVCVCVKGLSMALHRRGSLVRSMLCCVDFSICNTGCAILETYTRLG